MDETRELLEAVWQDHGFMRIVAVKNVKLHPSSEREE
jgi:hypothetical protein